MSDRVVEWRLELEPEPHAGDEDDLWGRLGRDLTALVLSKLPLRSMLRASAVCRAWRAALRAAGPSLKHGRRRRRPWLFLHGRSNAIPRFGRNAFAYDPDEPSAWVSFTLPLDCCAGAAGLAFASPSPFLLAFAPFLREGQDDAWGRTPRLACSRCNPVVTAVPSGSGSERGLLLLVAGGTRFQAGGLADVEDQLPLPTEIYEHDPDSGGAAGAWEQCAPLPSEFGTGSSSTSLLLSAALVGERFFFVCGTYSCTLSAFDLSRRAWTAPRELRPAPGLVAAFVATGRGGHRLLLAAVEEGGCTLGVWDVEPLALAARKIGEMPAEMAASMLPGSLRCVGQDGVLYVLSKEQHRGYPACACEVVGDDGDELSCRWSKMPPLPVVGRNTLGRFYRMVAFCSPVLMCSGSGTTSTLPSDTSLLDL